MAKHVTLHDGKKDYVLEFNVASVEQTERWGFDISQLGSKPMTMMNLLIRGAFLMHYSDVSRKKIDEVISHIQNKDKLVEALVELYQEPFNGMFNSSDDEKNSNWEVEE